MKAFDEEGNIIDVDDVGIPGLIPVTDRDIEEEMQNNEALWNYRHENNDQ